MSNILDQIVEKTAEDLAKRKKKVSFNDFNSFEGFEKESISFKGALRDNESVSIISEVKKASPSKGIIRPDFDPVDIALRYEEGGASAISVLTDQPFFKGDLKYLEAISKRVKLPLLRKDFIIDPYQMKEAKAYGADAALIIVAITEGSQLDELLHAAREFELDALVECYDQEDFNRINFELVDILGVNNRDLKNFEVDVHRGIGILQQAPEGTVLVSESGLSSGKDLALLQQEGIHSALIGEYFMRQDDPGQAVKDLIEQTKEEFERLQKEKEDVEHG
ncbi:MAG: indole-3-glycerol phosphate synthase TrpC [Gracilimonas sp.]|uniref:indole-3-glycerol phosphate synthase TrpC n=1 Tax=Gracilimonas TaxID=649462 RepID=UPI001B2156C8|nr:indole-3-glycerol phosphate synthase TrpC [Gracilimonas sp.]MBO6586443.1 indole-3-glycerol phosphate synthase TrpC [Gracilimonas sp.]MBO6615100.1 indole-3-glycerol phosphate synthase TrpC [Gracilimonas sp.]